jgi:ferredoxin
VAVHFTIQSKSDAKSVQVDCYRSLNLLAHAQMEELETGSRCGGWGECGGDRILITAGAQFLTPLTDAEREHLSTTEIEQGYRLACQVFPDRPDSENAEIHAALS